MLILLHKPENSNETNESLQCTFTSEDIRKEGYTVENTVTTTASMTRCFLCTVMFTFCLFIYGCFGYVCVQGWRAYEENKKMSGWDWNA